VFWFGVDDTYSTVYIPVYCGVTEVPRNFAVGTGSWTDVTWDSAFWVFNYVSNFAYLRYSDMIKDIQVVQRELEGKFLADQPQIDSGALALYDRSPRLAKDYLTEYSYAAGAEVVERWRELGKFLLYRYLDGNVKDEKGNVTHPGYPESWYQMVAESTGDRLKVRKLEAEREAERKRKEKAGAIAQSLIALLDARGISVDETAREKILGTEKPKQLETWLVRAATAGSTDEMFDGD
jgi:hypothetical protein